MWPNLWSERIKNMTERVKNMTKCGHVQGQSMTKFVVVRGQVCGQVRKVGQIKSGVSPHDAGHGN